MFVSQFSVVYYELLSLQLSDFIEGHYLQEQVEAIKQLSDYVTNLKRVGTGLGEYIFDKNTLGDSSD